MIIFYILAIIDYIVLLCYALPSEKKDVLPGALWEWFSWKG